MEQGPGPERDEGGYFREELQSPTPSRALYRGLAPFRTTERVLTRSTVLFVIADEGTERTNGKSPPRRQRSNTLDPAYSRPPRTHIIASQWTIRRSEKGSDTRTCWLFASPGGGPRTWIDKAPTCRCRRLGTCNLVALRSELDASWQRLESRSMSSVRTITASARAHQPTGEHPIPPPP